MLAVKATKTPELRVIHKYLKGPPALRYITREVIESRITILKFGCLKTINSINKIGTK